MYILKEKSTHRAVLVFADDSNLTLDSSGLTAPNITVSDVSSETHEIVVGDLPSLPLYWVAGALDFVDGAWSIGDQVAYEASLPQAQAVYQKAKEEKAAQVRADRNGRLAACDWTQLADAPVDAVAWAAYRQDLRDVPSQAGFPWEINWSVAP